jgi:thiamine-phosphate pyrophosphorylase
MRVGHEGLRTRGAKLAAAAEALKRASREKGGAEARFSLAFLTDRRRIPDPEPILRALPLGAAVLYRDYDDPKRPALARRYSVICRRRGVLFLVAGDIRLALAVCADGLHLPARALSSSACRREKRLLLTAACHDAAELARAGVVGADLAFLSPAFPTQSHPGTEHLGPARFRALASASPLPVLALGGVDERNAPLLAGKNVAGIAAIGAFLSPAAPG